MKDLIRRLTEAFGPSGFEDQVRDLIASECRTLADEIRTDAMGNLIVLKKGSESSQRVLLSAHMDEIGVMASTVDDKGFIRFVPIGNSLAIAMLGSRVQFANGAVGVIGSNLTFAQLMRERMVPPVEEMFIDVGCKERAACPVAVGDPAVFVRPWLEQNGYMVGKAMDDRVACVAQIEALRRLSTPAYDTYFCFSVQEELGLRGATTASYAIDPTFAIAIDLTPTRDFPEGKPLPTVLGGGAAIKVRDSGMITHRKFMDWMIRVAKERGIRYQLEVLDFGTTDARDIQISRAGIITGAVSIPARYVHTPSEMVCLDDVEQSAALLAALLSERIEV